MNFINKPETALSSLTISQARVAIPAIFGKLFDKYEYEREGHSHINGNVYDIYKVLADKEEFTFYDDITAFYGRGKLIQNLWEKDMPNPDNLYPIENFLDIYYQQYFEEGLRNGVDISKIKVCFKRYASNMVSNYIAAYYPSRNQIDVTPVKEYDKKFDFPILHSYNLYKLFILHQVDHIVKHHDFTQTEIELNGNYYQIKIGIECTQFVPNNKRTHANEFINYMFWVHKPGAFNSTVEQIAFYKSAVYGINSNLFEKEELIQSIKLSRVDERTESLLIASLEGKFLNQEEFKPEIKPENKMKSNLFEEIRSSLQNSYLARIEHDVPCVCCGSKNLPMYFHAIEYYQDEDLELPDNFVPMSKSRGVIRGCFPICVKCARPCSKCQLPMQTEKLLEKYANLRRKYGEGVNAGNGIDKHIHLRFLPYIIFKRIFKIGRFNNKE